MLEIRVGTVASTAGPSAPDTVLPYVQLAFEFVSALAWPAAVVIVALIFRQQLRNLLARVRHLSMPGGLEAQFVELQEETTRAAKSAPELPIGADLFDQFFSLSRGVMEANPDAAVFEAFAAATTRITDLARRSFPSEAPLTAERALQLFVSRLEVNPVVIDLFRRLTLIRDGAAHGAPTSPEEAKLFVESAKVLLSHLPRTSE